MDIIVRKYEDNDLDSVNIVLEEAFNRKKNNFSSDEFIELVSQCDDDISGYLLMTRVLNPIKNKYYFLIDYVCVLSKYRGIGVSDKLMKCAEEIAREEGVIYLQLTCSRFRESAHKLYERCGFEKRDSDIYRKVIV